MKRGDIVRAKRDSFVGLCATNTLPSRRVVVLFYNGHDFKTAIKNSNDMEVIEFADGRINEALFPKNEEVEQRKFEEEFYYNEIPIGQLIRPAPIHFDPDRCRAVARRWARDQNIADRPI